jgi:hypothetical protein
MLPLCIDEIIGDYECGFLCNSSTIDQIFCIHPILEKKLEYKDKVHQLVIDFKRAYDSVRREVLYNILIESGVPMKLGRLIKTCLNETYGKAHVGNHLSDVYHPESSKGRRNFIITAFKLCFGICH